MIVIAHNIRSLYNVGAFFRTCDAFGVEHLYLTGYTATPPRPEIAKTALGADETVPWTKERDIVPVIERLRLDGYTVVALEADPRLPSIRDASFTDKLTLIFGNEPDGLSPEVMAHADCRLTIPMLGKKSSLNVAVACGVALYALGGRSAILKS